MPPKKQAGKKKLGAKEKKRLEEQLKITRLLKEVRRNYERNCFLEQSYCHVELRNHIKNCAEEGKHLAKVKKPINKIICNYLCLIQYRPCTHQCDFLV